MNLRTVSSPCLISKKNIVLLAAVLMYAMLLSYNLYSSISHQSLPEWVFTDWLVNYTSGFVRRGLGGSILLFFAKNYGLNIHAFLTGFIYLIYLVVSCFYLQRIIRSYRLLDTKALVTFLFLPSLLLFPLLDPSAFGRKEILFIIPLIINLSLIDRELSSKESVKVAGSLTPYCRNVCIWFNLLSVPLALIHESIVFLALPINIIITISFLGLKLSRKNSILVVLVIYLPTLIAILAGFIWKGDAASASNICESWQGFTSLDCGKEAPAALGAIGWSLKKGVSLSWSILKTKHGFLFAQWLILFCVNFILLVFASCTLILNQLCKISTKTTANLAKTEQIFSSFSFKYIILPLVLSIPLYILGWDWGRWFYISSISYAFCCLTPGLIHLEVLNQNSTKRQIFSSSFMQKSIFYYSKVANSVLAQFKRCLWGYFALLSYAILFVKLPHCCLIDSVFYQGLLTRLISLF